MPSWFPFAYIAFLPQLYLNWFLLKFKVSSLYSNSTHWLFHQIIYQYMTFFFYFGASLNYTFHDTRKLSFVTYFWIVSTPKSLWQTVGAQQIYAEWINKSEFWLYQKTSSEPYTNCIRFTYCLLFLYTKTKKQTKITKEARISKYPVMRMNICSSWVQMMLVLSALGCRRGNIFE